MALSHGGEVTRQVVLSAIAVHRALGPGLLESLYEECLCCELRRSGVAFERQKPLAVVYYDVRVECGFRLDLLVERTVVVELKVVERIAPIHAAQILTYMRLGKFPLGLLFNFNSTVLKDAIRRFAL
jgi:GxxExxY protein